MGLQKKVTQRKNLRTKRLGGTQKILGSADNIPIAAVTVAEYRSVCVCFSCPV